MPMNMVFHELTAEEFFNESIHFDIQAGQLVITGGQFDQELVMFLKTFLFSFAGPLVRYHP